jgi:hypothetical protein
LRRKLTTEAPFRRAQIPDLIVRVIHSCCRDLRLERQCDDVISSPEFAGSAAAWHVARAAARHAGDRREIPLTLIARADEVIE